MLPAMQNKEDVYIVGTEEGTVHKCSKAYSSEYLSTYSGHNMAVYSVKWNRIHEDVFLSASADWTVKMWHASRNVGAIMTFDMQTSVGDIAWAPYSSTVFAVCTSDGKVSVFDVAQQKHKPMCQQKIVKKARLTKIVFNPKHPILLVGDDRGCVTSLKLSPNLRKCSIIEGGQVFKDMEKKKLNDVIDVALKSRASNGHEP
jgi:dynein intermediate chain 1, axonemal